MGLWTGSMNCPNVRMNYRMAAMWDFLERLVILVVAANVIFVVAGLYIRGFTPDDASAFRAFTKRLVGSMFRRHS
jgi:hypothetical protein